MTKQHDIGREIASYCFAGSAAFGLDGPRRAGRSPKQKPLIVLAKSDGTRGWHQWVSTCGSSEIIPAAYELSWLTFARRN